MDAKHTPGPWIAVPNGGDDEDIRALLVGKNDQYGDFTTIADCRSRWIPDEEANARLIAAAPDMLAALTLVEPILGRGPVTQETIEAYKAVADTIARANGMPPRAKEA
jgi:hypothetical protein